MDEGVGDQLLGQNAYQILGVDENSTFPEVKSAFRRLAKETHPDIVSSSGGGEDASASRKFLLILSAYEVIEFHRYYLCLAIHVPLGSNLNEIRHIL